MVSRAKVRLCIVVEGVERCCQVCVEGACGGVRSQEKSTIFRL